ncbi:MAG: 50S ribosomal protein L3 N(5)-glutamine methyltransferase [Methylococcaceae bacterium]|nr:50S ribosomal protein L3 N(5)-glutamine methyltransferase [Methylococcaceae bacterium]MDZ4156424.1 50S ribosomal protein L3 N(5)-glutamine methyltransferase [Methylococcales bacterium]MDP2391640.1 50S ribosomal protein L3 N(5)-glutamine methyltransferase [Methylococcaceae bacterium]MDP3018139.1 50S ribosomal protein L3 N(5)-glutamine methyltransferase [Methylococcaceae bacterium]MDP3389352.1 50S ribosomal protein L3 N(5)-glutamine methyltransferase [Methylococcaceae bacterium]
MKTTSADVLTTLTTIRDYVRWSASQFAKAQISFGHGTTSALDEAVALVLHTVHQPYNLSETYFDSVLTLSERQAIIDLVDRRINERIPAAYLTHEAIFAGLSFYVDERVLVPRSPIAELIAQRFSPWVDEDQVERVLDLCTGSACIAIACAYAFPDALVDAVDLSPDALAVAEINVAKHQLTDSVALYKSDLFKQLPEEQYDIIVSNPPYVSNGEWSALAPEFRAEPDMGFLGGESGLELVLRILTDAGDYLTEQGILVVEVGSSAQTLQDAFPDVPFYWLDFEHGGDGVFLLTADQVNQYHPLFIAALN